MKILIISHTCFSTYNNMGKTFLSLFSTFAREELCQLYIYPSLPDVDVCGAYYRVTDKDMLRSLVKRGTPGGPLNPGEMTFGQPAALENPADSAIYQQNRNASAAARLGRDAVWKLGRWDTSRLRAWVEQQKPDCIFLAPGYAEFIYDIAMKIGAEYSLPVVTYLCDDHYFVLEPEDLLGRWQLSRLRRKMDSLMARTARLVTICEEMKEAYVRRFCVPAQVIMTGSDRASPEKKSAPGMGIAYFGNLSVNRDLPVAEVGRVLDRINGEKGTDWHLDLYTPELPEQLRQRFADIRSIRLRGFVSGEAFRESMDGADLLLHVEAFDEKTVDRTKHSVSTKIADALTSGIPLLAYGPENVASMAHLRRNGCAFTAHCPEELEKTVCTALEDREARRQVLDRAEQTAREFHDRQKNSLMLRRIFEEIHERTTENRA